MTPPAPALDPRDAGWPGAELVGPGLDDLGAGRATVPALLVAILRPRLERLGVAVPACPGLPRELELALYAALGADGEPDPYGRYNALLRRVDRYARALEAEVGRRLRASVSPVASAAGDPAPSASVSPSTSAATTPTASPDGAD